MSPLKDKQEYDIEAWVKENYENEHELFSHFYDCFTQSNYIFDLIEEVNSMKNLCELYQTTDQFMGLQNAIRLVPPKLNCENNNFMNVCSTVELKTTVDGFCYVEARKTLISGLIVAREKPQILYCKPNCLCLQKPAHHCHYCGRILVLFQTCEECEMCVYCNETFMANAWNKYHKWECDGIRRHYWNDMSYFAMRMLFIGVPSKFIEKSGNKITYYDDEYSGFSHLHANIEEKSKQALSRILMDVLRTLVYLIERTNFFAMIMRDKVFPGKTLFGSYMEIGWRLFKHQCQAMENVVTLGQYNTNLTELNDPISYENQALCISLNAFNHDCNPNAILFPVEEYIVMKTLRKIKYGEEICVNYYDSTDFVQYLKGNYRERCTCLSCLKYQPTNEAYICVKKKCKGRVLPNTLECPKCKTKRSDEEILNVELKVRKLRNEFYKTKEYSSLNLAIKTYEDVSHKYCIKLADLYMSMAYYLADKRFAKSYCNFMSALRIYEKLLPKYAPRILKKKLDYVFCIVRNTPVSCVTDGTELSMALKALSLAKEHVRYFHMYPKLFAINFEMMKIRENLKALSKTTKIPTVKKDKVE